MSDLNKYRQEILALIYFPEAEEMTDNSRVARLQSLKLNCKAQKEGRYKMDVLRMDDIVFVSIR